MKITLTRNTKDHQLKLSTKTMEKLLERIAQDDAKDTIKKFRNYLRYLDTPYIETDNMKTWLHIIPAGEFEKDSNNNLVFKHNNGILLITFKNIGKKSGVEEMKNIVSTLPSTFAAIEGADENSLHVWVKYSDKEGSLPTNENDAEQLYRAAYRQIMPIYRTVANHDPDGTQPSLNNYFLMTLDCTPYYNNKAVPIKVNAYQGEMQRKASDTPTDGKDGASGDLEKGSIKDNITSMMNLLKGKYVLL